MKVKEPNIVYTIGHSTHPIDKFIRMLQSFDIRVLVDIRAMPGSRKFPQFDQENLTRSLADAGIRYVYSSGLGGRRKRRKDSLDTVWRNTSFQAYADYMETTEFEKAVIDLQQTAIERATAYMCSEAVWWRCHRSLVSDYLKAKGWQVLHIMAIGEAQEHRYTAPAVVTGDKVSYEAKDVSEA